MPSLRVNRLWLLDVFWYIMLIVVCAAVCAWDIRETECPHKVDRRIFHPSFEVSRPIRNEDYGHLSVRIVGKIYCDLIFKGDNTEVSQLITKKNSVKQITTSTSMCMPDK